MTRRGWKYMEKLTDYNFKADRQGFDSQSLLMSKWKMFWRKIGSTLNRNFWTFWYYNPIYTFFTKGGTMKTTLNDLITFVDKNKIDLSNIFHDVYIKTAVCR